MLNKLSEKVSNFIKSCVEKLSSTDKKALQICTDKLNSYGATHLGEADLNNISAAATPKYLKGKQQAIGTQGANTQGSSGAGAGTGGH